MIDERLIENDLKGNGRGLLLRHMYSGTETNHKKTSG
jgi:hypothetical protein